MTMFLARKSLSQVMVRSIPRASALPSTFIPSSRFISSSSILRSDAPPVIQGEGAKAGQVATDEQQATGLERFELLGKLSGKDVFDMEPLEMTRLGTTKDPIVIDSLFPIRQVGCTGFPADSHDTIWLATNTEIEHHRCPECGSVYKLNYIGAAHGDDHH